MPENYTPPAGYIMLNSVDAKKATPFTAKETGRVVTYYLNKEDEIGVFIQHQLADGTLTPVERAL